MPISGWGPPAIDPGAISGLLDPYIERQKQLRAGSALSQGLDALTKGDYSGMAKAMQVLAVENPTLATHLMSTYETEQARKREEARFQEQMAQTGKAHEADVYFKSQKPEVIQEGDPEYGGPKGYRTPGMPPGYEFKYLKPGQQPAAAAPAAVPAPALPPAQTSSPTPAVTTPPPATPAPAPAPVPTPAPAIAPAAPAAPVAPIVPEPLASGSAARAAVINALRSGLEGEQLMAALPPNWARAVKQIANYERSPSDLSMRGTMQDRKLYEDLATAYDKTYNPANYPIVAKHLAGYATTTGAGAGARLNNLNTASGHVVQLETLNSELAKVRPTDVPAINALYQKVGVAFGHPEVTNWNMLRAIVAPELAKVIGGGLGLGVEERLGLQNNLSSSASLQQALGYIHVLKDAMAQRYSVAHQQFNNETFEKRPYEFAKKLSGDSMKMMLTKEGIDVRAVNPGDLEKLLKHRTDKEAMTAFDQHYGEGAAGRIIDGLR